MASFCLRWYGRGNRKLKFDDELVTEAENRADIIQNKISGSFDGHGFLRDLSEEQLKGPGAPRFLWIVDTLDGAASFQAGMPVWGVSAALFRRSFGLSWVFFIYRLPVN